MMDRLRVGFSVHYRQPCGNLVIFRGKTPKNCNTKNGMHYFSLLSHFALLGALGTSPHGIDDDEKDGHGREVGRQFLRMQLRMWPFIRPSLTLTLSLIGGMHW